MKSRLLQLTKGTIEYPTPDISFGAERLTGTLLPGRNLSLDTTVSSENGVPMRVFFYSQNARVKVSQPMAFGRTGRLTLEINTVGCRPADVISGEIDVLYNGGETKLPYEFHIGMGSVEAVDLNFPTLQSFYEYAKEDFDRAVKAFSWKEISGMPFMRSLKNQAAYQLYYSQTSSDSGLSEFLGSLGYTEFLKQEADVVIPEKNPEQKNTSPRSFLTEERIRTVRMIRLFLRFDRQLAIKSDTQDQEIMPAIRALLQEYPDSLAAHLLNVYAEMRLGNFMTARQELIGIQDQIQKVRVEQKDLYCLFVYLAGAVQEDRERITMAERLTHKYFMDGCQTLLMHDLEYRLNPELLENNQKKAAYLQQMYGKGFRNPIVFEETCILWQHGVISFTSFSEYELHTLLYGLRNGLISEKVLFSILSKELKNPRCLNLYMQVLKLSYKMFRNSELLFAICNVYLQSGCYGERYFRWYREGIQHDLTIPGLNEYYLASLPKNFDEKLPEKLVHYFGLGQENNSIPLNLLYENVATYYRNNSEIRELYRERIAEHTFKKLKNEEYSVRLIPLIRDLLVHAVPTEQTAPVLLECFYLHQIRTSLKDVKRAVVFYPQFQKAMWYELEAGEALLPIFSENVAIGFEDERGRVHYDPQMFKRLAFHHEELKKQCSFMVQETTLLLIGRADRILKEGAEGEQDIRVITDLIKDKNTDAFFRARLYESLIALSSDPAFRHIDCMEYLLEADFSTFSPEYQAKFLTALIQKGYLKECYQKILEYGYDKIDDDSLSHLVEYMVKLPLVQGDRTMVAICYQLYRNGKANTAVYAFLAAYYNGNSNDMVTILKNLRKRRQPTYDLCERALIVCLFVNQLKDLDTLFDIYMNEGKQDEQIKTAYLILRSHDYFIRKKKLSDIAVRELKKSVFRLPRVASLAVLSWLSENVMILTADEKLLAEALLRKAVNENFVLACFEKLARHVEIPVELEGRVYTEFRSPSAVEVQIVGQLYPGSRLFTRSLQQVYPGVFARSFILYKREWLQFDYSVLNRDGSHTQVEAQMIVQEAEPSVRGSRYDEIGHLERRVEKAELRECAELLRTLILKDAMIEEVFGE